MRRILLAFALVLLATATQASDPTRLTMYNYGQIEKGCTLDNVMGWLGQHDSVPYRSGEYKILIWESGSKYVRILFHNDKVEEKRCWGL